jgi:Cys-rich protein (TIGR01571 family)
MQVRKTPEDFGDAMPVYDTNDMYVPDTQNMLPVNTMNYDDDDFGVDWNSGICGCCTCDRPWVCFMACVSPCLLFGEIHHALYQNGVADDTSKRTLVPNVRCNTAACEFCLLDYPLSATLGLFFSYIVGCTAAITAMSCCTHNITLRRIRHNNPGGAISGTRLLDILLTFFCSCCVLVQEHKQMFPPTQQNNPNAQH